MTMAWNIRADAMQRLTEIANHGCEAASARSYEEGRLAVLDALGLGMHGQALDRSGKTHDVTLVHAIDIDSDEMIRQRRLELDEALRERGTSRPDRDVLASEPIVHRDSVG